MDFQDDGARTFYEPYPPNTGFYFVLYEERTFYFLSCLVRMGDKNCGSRQPSSGVVRLLMMLILFLKEPSKHTIRRTILL